MFIQNLINMKTIWIQRFWTSKIFRTKNLKKFQKEISTLIVSMSKWCRNSTKTQITNSTPMKRTSKRSIKGWNLSTITWIKNGTRNLRIGKNSSKWCPIVRLAKMEQEKKELRKWWLNLRDLKKQLSLLWLNRLIRICLQQSKGNFKMMTWRRHMREQKDLL